MLQHFHFFLISYIKGKVVTWIGHVLRRNALLKHFIEKNIEGTEDEEEDVSSYWVTLQKNKTLQFEKGNIRSHPVENSPWKRLQTWIKTD
jgi:hypothetical protein